MKYKEYLKEVELDTDPNLNYLFSVALRQVFSINFLAKIDQIIKKNIKIKTVNEKPGVIGYNQGETIFVNKNEFFQRSEEQQVRYLLHEFMHILQRKRGMFFRKFPEIKNLTNDLKEIISKNSKYPLSVFLTGKKQDLGPGQKWEILSYFMNDSINWNAISAAGKQEMIKAFESSRIFNLDHAFWKKRMS